MGLRKRKKWSPASFVFPNNTGFAEETPAMLPKVYSSSSIDFVHVLQVTGCILSFRDIESEVPSTVFPKVQSKLKVPLRKMYARDEMDPLICSVQNGENGCAMKLFLKESAGVPELDGFDDSSYPPRTEAVAALAPGVFPLLISAAEHFNNTVQPFKYYKNSIRDIDPFLKPSRYLEDYN